jgi:hypothetical protein
MAAVLERWQVLEMEVDGSYSVVCRIARLVMLDPAFSALLRVAVQGRQAWLRDIAGVIFRFWGLLQEGGVSLSPEQASPVLQAVEVILAPLEAPHPAELCGHFYGTCGVSPLCSVSF